MNNELLSGTQLRFTEQSSQYEASFTGAYCGTPTTRMHDKARTLEKRDKFNPIPLDLYSYNRNGVEALYRNPGPDAQQATAARKIPETEFLQSTISDTSLSSNKPKLQLALMLMCERGTLTL